jgi:thermitase
MNSFITNFKDVLMNISKLKQRLERITPTNLSLPSVLAGSIMSWCLVGNASFAAPTSPDFPKFSPLEMATIKGVPSTKILFKLKSIPKIGTAAGTADRGSVQPIDRKNLQPSGVDALGKKFNAKVTPLLKDNLKKNKSSPRLSKVYVAEFPGGTNMEEALQTVKADPTVEYAELNGIVQAVKMPNDPYFDDYQWALHNIGQTGGTPDADIDAPKAWDIPPGKASIMLAVVDTGVDWNHQDLQGKVTLGWDFAYDDPYPDDVYGHGTHVAGIAAANGDEGIGIAGVCWECQILAVKVLTDGGWGYWEWVAAGIEHAWYEKGAKIINLSLGGSEGSKVLHEAIIDAYDAGVTVVAAAGNGYGPPVGYPAKYPEAIAVSATDHNDQLAWFSSYGPEVDIAAPGVDILSSLPGNDYAWWSGTSMATPHVAGAICNCLSLNSSLSPAEIYDLVTTTADDLPPAGWDNYFGAGRLNLAALLDKCGGGTGCLGESCTIEGNGGIIYGTNGDDVICGSNKNETILAKAGNDLICAGGGNDIVVADVGHDKVDGGLGDDIIKGGSGKDVLKGGPGNDIILGSTQDDVLVGSTGDDYLHGGNGNDVLLGQNGNDQLCGKPGNKDYVNGGPGYDKCDDGGKWCSEFVPCPIINVLEINPSSPALVNSLNVMKGLGISLDVNQ